MGKEAQKRAANAAPPATPFKWFWAVLGLILLFSFSTKIYRLSEPGDFYFDEVYHGFTATRYLHGDRAAYDPWAPNPPGKAMEWTHPPLAKLIMAGMMEVFGENSLGWRVGSVVFGTAATGMTALLALEIFESPFIALLSAFFFSIEGLLFAQSRIAMNDIYFIFFMLFTFLFYVRWKKSHIDKHLYLSGLGLGLAAATKWTALYVAGIIFIDLVHDILKNKSYPNRIPFLKLFIAMLGIPAFLYIASYAQFFWLGWDWERFKVVQSQMWWYHSGLKATHPYSSKPLQWIFNLRPVWMWGSRTEGHIANIYNTGNSVILLSGLVAVFFAIFKEPVPTWKRWFILLCYFMLWVPWAISPRIMLFYHYAPALPFLCIILARFMEKLMSQSKPIWVYGIVGTSLLWFVVFYPHLTALSVPEWMGSIYFAVPGWR